MSSSSENLAGHKTVRKVPGSKRYSAVTSGFERMKNGPSSKDQSAGSARLRPVVAEALLGVAFHSANEPTDQISDRSSEYALDEHLMLDLTTVDLWKVPCCRHRRPVPIACHGF